MTQLSEHLLSLLACPVCLGPVEPGPGVNMHRWLHCRVCLRYYPVVDGIPVMIAGRATSTPPK